MTTFQPVYRMTVYEPRSEDATETTVLSPIGGAAHSDPFKVATKQGLSGYQGYLEIPKGRKGRLDLLTRRVDTGQLTIVLLDKRTGTSNLSRWVTAFLGGTTGAPRLLGCKVYVEESVDNAVSFAAYFTGRINKINLDNPVHVSLECRDMSTDLTYDCFVGRPEATATGYVEPFVLPLGNSAAYGLMPVANPLSGTFASDSPYRTVTLTTTSANRADNIVTSSLTTRSRLPLAKLQVAPLSAPVQTGLRLRFTTAGVTNKEAEIVGMKVNYHGKFQVTQFTVRALSDTSDLYYSSLSTGTIPNTTACTFTVRQVVTPTDDQNKVSIKIADAHPAQVWKDMLDGKWSRLNPDGTVTRSFPYDSSAFTALIADTSIPKARFILTQPVALQEFVERYILQPYGLGMYLDGTGQVVPIDLRPPSASPTSTTIADADLVAGQTPSWTLDREQAITRLTVRTYTDYAIDVSDVAGSPGSIPNVGTALIESAPTECLFPSFGNPDLGEKSFTIDAIGLRDFDGEVYRVGSVGNVLRAQYIFDQASALASFYAAPFSKGPMFTTLELRRTANTTGVVPGAWRILDCDMLPDPGSNLRGGARLARCVELTPNGLTLTSRWVDAGPNTIATAPTVGTPTQETGNTTHGLSVTVTVNASSEPVELWVNSTLTSVGSRPSDTDAAWVLKTVLEHPTYLIPTTGSKTVRTLGGGLRHWVRVRTTPVVGKKLASVFAYPSGTGYVDSATLAACTTVAVGSVTTKAATVTWSNNGDTTSAVVLRLVGGASQAAADAAVPVDYRVLPPGTTTFPLVGLDTGGPWWHVQVLHDDGLGGLSATAQPANSFQATGTANTAPTPGGLLITRSGAVPPSGAFLQLPPGTSAGIELELVPAPTGFGLGLSLERAPDSGGSPGTYAVIASLDGGSVGNVSIIYQDVLPVDGSIYWYRMQHVGDGLTASAYTTAISGVPGWLVPVNGFQTGSSAGQATLGTTQTVVISGGCFQPELSTTLFQRTIQSMKAAVIATTIKVQANVFVPAGIRLTSWILVGWRANAGDILNAELWDVGVNTTNIDNITSITGVPAQNQNALAYVMGNTNLVVLVTLRANAALNDNLLSYVGVDYVRDDHNQL